MAINKSEWKKNIEARIARDYFKTLNEVSNRQLQFAFTRETLNLLWRNWRDTQHNWEKNKCKMLYYFSAEFLMGRWLGNAMINLDVGSEGSDLLKEIGMNANLLEEAEADAGLGNGGLGRLAACFLDSLATMDMPAMGYGIRYRYGMFEQIIVNNKQVEIPDYWLKRGDPVSIVRVEETRQVKFGGKVVVHRDSAGRLDYRVEDADIVNAVPYDMPVVGYKTKTVLSLRLWQAESPDGFDLGLFQDEQYAKSVEKENHCMDISRVLYPNDRGPSGKALRLRQQFFFVSAGLQDIIAHYKRVWGKDLSSLPEAVAIQLNDTHPVVAIPELMRILVDEEGLDWNDAWGITIRCCAYTNHTIMSEALEKWPIDIFSGLLPRQYLIVEEINRRFLDYLRQLNPRDWQRHNAMAIIADGVIKMAWLAIVGSHSVNGVAELHTEILKNKELKLWYDIFPEKFNNKTNGITQRRWLLKSNPALSAFITKLVGDDWVLNMSKIIKLADYADDDKILTEFMAIKKRNKELLAAYVQKNHNITLDVDSIFDVQVKRLHEYKRQLMNVIHILWLYKKLKANPALDICPRTFIFGAKAASGYRTAKEIIYFINVMSEIINNDFSVNRKLKVVFLPNYSVSLAEKIIPAADISEQISTAGYEASGTGNMKFMMNGALTVGTMDGSTVEIVQEAGAENAFIFGMSSQEVTETLTHYNPQDLLARDHELADALTCFLRGPFVSDEDSRGSFEHLYNSLVYGVDGDRPDKYLCLKDFRAYVEAHEKIDRTYRNKKAWAKMALLNVAHSGKFSSDRTITQYAEDIWHIEPCRLK